MTPSLYDSLPPVLIITTGRIFNHHEPFHVTTTWTGCAKNTICIGPGGVSDGHSRPCHLEAKMGVSNRMISATCKLVSTNSWGNTECVGMKTFIVVAVSQFDVCGHQERECQRERKHGGDDSSTRIQTLSQCTPRGENFFVEKWGSGA